MQVKKKAAIHEEEGGSVDDRSLYTRLSNKQGLNDNKESLVEALRTRTLYKKSATDGVRMEDRRDPKHLGIDPVRALMMVRPLRCA